MSGLMKFANNATTTIATDGGTTLTVASSATFPVVTTTTKTYFYATLIRNSDQAKEIVKVTNITGTTWTVTRAQEGTTQLTFVSGDRIEQRITAGSLSELNQGVGYGICAVTWYTTAGTGVHVLNPRTRAVVVKGWGGGAAGGYIPAGTTFRIGNVGGCGGFMETFHDFSYWLAYTGKTNETVYGLKYTVGAGGVATTTTAGNGGSSYVELTTVETPGGIGYGTSYYGGRNSTPSYLSVTASTTDGTNLLYAPTASVGTPGTENLAIIINSLGYGNGIKCTKPTTASSVYMWPTINNIVSGAPIPISVVDGQTDPIDSMRLGIDTSLFNRSLSGYAYGIGGGPAALPSGENRAQSGSNGRDGALCIIEYS